MNSPKFPNPLTVKIHRRDGSFLLMLPLNLENLWFYIWAVVVLYDFYLISQHK